MKLKPDERYALYKEAERVRARRSSDMAQAMSAPYMTEERSEAFWAQIEDAMCVWAGEKAERARRQQKAWQEAWVRGAQHFSKE